MRLLPALMCVLLPISAQAGPITLSGSGTLTSDYHSRGLSQSNGEPAAQASLNANHSSGVYAGFWASTLASGAQANTAAELDSYIGYHKTTGLLSYDLGATYYSYLSGADPALRDRVEGYASLSGTLALTTAKIGVDVAPRQGNDARANLYGYAELSQAIPRTPVTLHAHLGYTRAAADRALTPAKYNEGNYMDYSVGADYVWQGLTVNLSWADTDISAARAVDYGFTRYDAHSDTKGRVIVSLTAGF